MGNLEGTVGEGLGEAYQPVVVMHFKACNAGVYFVGAKCLENERELSSVTFRYLQVSFMGIRMWLSGMGLSVNSIKE